MTTKKPIPPPVLDALVAAGTIGRDRIGRNAQLRTCGRCRQWVVVGDDHHRCAMHVVCDPVTLTPLTEAMAVLVGRATYDVWGCELNRRSAAHIAGGQRRPVIADHDCGAATTPTPDVIAMFLPPTVAALPERAPF